MEKQIKIVGTARRKSIRDLNQPFSKDFKKYLAEIITNSDDSYKRLESKGLLDIDEVKEIIINIEKTPDNEYSIQITDYAEGLSLDKMEEVFLKYGGDNAGGEDYKTRGIFGQGASDVLFNSAFNKFESRIITFKDGIGVIATFIVDESKEFQRMIEFYKILEEDMNSLRSFTGISQNGTVIRFGVKGEYLKTKNMNQFIREIENFYTFRYIFSSRNRKVTLIFNNQKYVLNSEKYIFNDEEKLVEDILFKFKHEGKITNFKLSLYKSEKSIEDDETKILVTDNNHVIYANDFFKFDNFPKAKGIKGILVLDNIYEICKNYLNDEENASAVLTETRDGFNTKHPFYKDLFDTISPILSQIVDKHGRKLQEKDLTENKKFYDTLKEINKFLNKEIEESINGGPKAGIEPPSDGLRFVRQEISINKGKKYSIRLYANPQMIIDNSEINIILNSEKISADPIKIMCNHQYIQDGILTYNIYIEGNEITEDSVLITAESSGYEAKLLINVIEKDIYYPEDGMEFHSSTMRVKPNQTHVASLFIDTEKINLGTKINLLRSNDNIILQEDTIEVQISDLIDKKIAIKKIRYKVNEDITDYEVKAKTKDHDTKLDVLVREIVDEPKGTSGIINGFKTTPDDDAFYQSYFHQNDKYIYILEENYINKMLMPDLSLVDKSKLNYKKEDRVILADILASEIAKLLIKKLVDKGKISISMDGIDDYNNHLQRKKLEIFKIIHKTLV
jgi:hypothetical protein